MEPLDYWRLCDELSINHAALLVIGEEPTEYESINNWHQHDMPPGFLATRTAIRHALSSGGIEGTYFDKPRYDRDGDLIASIKGDTDYDLSTVLVCSLKVWLSSRGVKTGFFFPDATDTADYLDPAHPRYAPKLAAAVTAWQSVTEPGKKSVKQALEKWLRENAAKFEMVDDDGLPVNQAVEDCSKVANWNPSGGAPKTPG